MTKEFEQKRIDQRQKAGLSHVMRPGVQPTSHSYARTLNPSDRRRNQGRMQNFEPRDNQVPLAGGGYLSLNLKNGANPKIVNDTLIEAIDEAMKNNPGLKGRRVMLKNDNANARLTKAPKTSLMITGKTLAGVADHGVTDIQYHNASGKLAGSKHGEARYTASGTNHFENSKTTGHLTMKFVGDRNYLDNSTFNTFGGDLAAHSNGVNIRHASAKGYGAKGAEAGLNGSTLSGRHTATHDAAVSIKHNVDSEAKPASAQIIRLDVHQKDPRLESQKKAAFQRHLQMGVEATSGSNRVHKKELAYG